MFTMMVGVALAHPGKADANGCHYEGRDWHCHGVAATGTSTAPPLPAKPQRCWAASKLMGAIELEWKSPSELEAEEARQAEVELRPAEPLPVPGGLLIVRVYRITIDAANTEYFNVVVQDNAGGEILRYQPRSDTPEVPSRVGLMGAMWRNLFVVPLMEPLPDGARIHVVDSLLSARCTWTFTPPNLLLVKE